MLDVKYLITLLNKIILSITSCYSMALYDFKESILNQSDSIRKQTTIRYFFYLR